MFLFISIADDIVLDAITTFTCQYSGPLSSNDQEAFDLRRSGRVCDVE